MMLQRYLLYLVLTGLSINLACSPELVEDSPSSVGLLADSAMVVSAHPLASQVGADIMRQGGNAVVCPGGGLPGRR